MKSFYWGMMYSWFLGAMACGYGFVHLQDSLPGGIKTVSIPTFQNRTHEAGLENKLTADLRNEFFKSKIIGVVSANEAEGEISGVVTRMEVSSLAHSEENLTGRSKKILANVYRASLDIDVKLVRRSNGEVLWQRKFSDGRQYEATGDLLKNEVSQQQAFDKVSLYLAEQVHDMMLEDF